MNQTAFVSRIVLSYYLQTHWSVSPEPDVPIAEFLIIVTATDRERDMLRSVRERIIQTIAFELIGLLLVVPFFTAYTKTSSLAGVIILCVLSLLVMSWSALHNTLFDMLEWRFLARVASDRSEKLRAVHAVSLELTSMIVTLPVLVWLLDMSWGDALVLDIALTLVYVAYGYLFHRAFDSLRPVTHNDLKA